MGAPSNCLESLCTYGRCRELIRINAAHTPEGNFGAQVLVWDSQEVCHERS
jgi:hypothetical protein